MCAYQHTTACHGQLLWTVAWLGSQFLKRDGGTQRRAMAMPHAGPAPKTMCSVTFLLAWQHCGMTVSVIS